jgi:hypothetical protein
VIGAALTQSDEGKRICGAYLSQRLLDNETRYMPIEKLCSLYYLLTSSCTITFQYNIIKYMLQRPIFCGRLGKWAYSLVEYDLEYEALKALLIGLEVLVEVEAKRVEAFGDSELVVQQMKGESPCLSGELNEY